MGDRHTAFTTESGTDYDYDASRPVTKSRNGVDDDEPRSNNDASEGGRPAQRKNA